MKKLLLVVLFLSTLFVGAYLSCEEYDGYDGCEECDEICLCMINEIALQVAESFSYYKSIDPSAGNYYIGQNEIEGQCGDYALRFVLLWNEKYFKNQAELVVANNPITSGAYKVIGKRNDFDYSTWWSYPTSGFATYNWNGKHYQGIYHPILGFYEIELTRAYQVKKHYYVDMTDPKQVHVWAKVGNIAVDPCYADVWNLPLFGRDLE